MFRLIKFQLKSKHKILIALTFIYIIINLGLTLKGINDESNDNIIPALIIFCGFAVFAIIIFLSAAEFRKDLYEDSAYLIFATPQSSYSILGARLITAAIELLPFLIVAIIFFSISLIFIYPIGSGNLSNIHTRKEFLKLLCTTCLLKVVILIILCMLYSIIALLEITTITYFSLIISKALIRGKKLARVSAVLIFLLGVFVVDRLQLLGEIIPSKLTLDLTPFSLGNSNFSVSLADQSIPIWSEVFSLFFCIALFFMSGYIMDKKVDI